MRSPLSSVREWSNSLRSAFGLRYLAIVVAQYGVNQGIGNKLVDTAQKYYLLEGLRLSSAQAGSIQAAAVIPWQLKSLFGLLSDAVPIGGLRRAPYITLGGVAGVVSALLLALLPVSSVTTQLAATLLVLYNLNVAVADVMIDATLAERSKEQPHLAADLQVLSWGSQGLLGIPASLVAGLMLTSLGWGSMYATASMTSLLIAATAAAGWIGERRVQTAGATNLRVLLEQPAQRRVAAAALVTAAWSVVLGVVQLSAADAALVTATTVCGNALLCCAVYLALSSFDGVLAKALVYAFLQGALCPRSTIIFEWAHAPSHGSGDTRCFSADECAGLGGDAGDCGWARARGYPCISPVTYAGAQLIGSAALFLATLLYRAVLVTWSFRSIMGLTQAALALTHIVDLAWVWRLNVHLGLPDGLFLLGEEVLNDVVDRLNVMPFLIFAAKLCPEAVEGSMFALFMGLFNFGSSGGKYLGSGLLAAMGGVPKPDYPGLALFVGIRSAMRLLPVLLVPWLVPVGSPSSSADEMRGRQTLTKGRGELL